MPDTLLQLPLKGLNTTDEPLQLPDDQSPDLQNVRLRRQRIDKRPGLARFDSRTLVVGMATGRNILQASFTDADSADLPDRLVMLNDAILYEWQPSTSTWDAHVLQAPDVYAMATTERFGVVATFGAVYATAWDARIRSYDGMAYEYLAHDLGADPALLEIGINNAPPLSALTILAFANRLILVRTREGTRQHPARVRWCANGLPLKWDPGITDGCGFLDLVEDVTKPLTGGFTLNGRCYVTQERAIVELVATGSLEPVFRYETRSSGVGMIAPHSWASAEGFGFFLGADNVYGFDGSQPQAIGDAVIEEILEAIEYSDVLRGRPQEILGAVFPRESEYWLYVGGTAAGAQQKVFIYDYRVQRWYRDEVPFIVGAIGQWNPIEVPGGGSAQDAPTVILAEKAFGVASRGTFYQVPDQAYDVVAEDDLDSDHAAIDAYVTTKDQFPMVNRGGVGEPRLGRKGTVKRVLVQGPPGQKVKVAVSANRGERWQEREIIIRPEGVGVAYFSFPYGELRIRLRNDAREAMSVRGAVSYTWKQAGVVHSSG